MCSCVAACEHQAVELCCGAPASGYCAMACASVRLYCGVQASGCVAARAAVCAAEREHQVSAVVRCASGQRGWVVVLQCRE